MDSFDEEIIVECPRCSKAATVSSGLRLRCKNCACHHTRSQPRSFGATGVCFEHTSDLSDWFGDVLLRPTEPPRCRKCGNDVAYPPHRRAALERVVRTDDKATGQCATCGADFEFSARWVPFHDAGGVRERFFGTRLYLREETSKGIVWAYNRRHGEAIGKYVASAIRDSAVDEKALGLFANLPSWIKQAKNRGAVLTALAHVRKKLDRL